MFTSIRRAAVAALVLFLSFSGISPLFAQSAGNSGSIYGLVTDASGAVVPGAVVTVENPVSRYNRTTKSDGAGREVFLYVISGHKERNPAAAMALIEWVS